MLVTDVLAEYIGASTLECAEGLSMEYVASALAVRGVNYTPQEIQQVGGRGNGHTGRKRVTCKAP